MYPTATRDMGYLLILYISIGCVCEQNFEYAIDSRITENFQNQLSWIASHFFMYNCNFLNVHSCANNLWNMK